MVYDLTAKVYDLTAIDTGRDKDARTVLLDFDFLQAKLEATNINALIAAPQVTFTIYYSSNPRSVSVPIWPFKPDSKQLSLPSEP